jgi:hypothetical protein
MTDTEHEPTEPDRPDDDQPDDDDQADPGGDSDAQPDPARH